MKTPKFINWRTPRIAIEILAATALMLGLMLGASVWRLSQGPVNISFAKSYIEQALSDPESGVQVKIGDVALYFPELNGPLFLGVQNTVLLNENGRQLISLEEAGISLSKGHLFLGKISPHSLMLSKPNLYVVRHEDNSFDFGFSRTSKAEQSTPPPDQNILADTLEYLANAENDRSQNSPLAALQSLEIQDANIVIEDRKLQATWQAPDFDVLFEHRDNGLFANINIGFSEDNNQEDQGIEIDLFYDRVEKGIETTANIINFDSTLATSKFPELNIYNFGSLILSGQIQASVSTELEINHISAQLESHSGEITIKEIRKDPLHYKDLELELLYDGKEQKIIIPALSMALEDIPLHTDANFEFFNTEQGPRLQGRTSVKIPELEHARIQELWPESIDKEDDASEWVLEKIRQASYTNLSADAQLIIDGTGEEFRFDLLDLKARYDFENADVLYKKSLTPVKNGAGAGTFDRNRDLLAVYVTKGMINDITVNKADILVTDVIAEGKGDADITVDISGPLKSHLLYASDDPINLGKKHDIERFKKAEGNADLLVKLVFPTRKNVLLKDMQIDITGNLKNATIPEAVGDLPLREGDLDLTINSKTAKITGTAMLENSLVSLTHEQFLKSEGKPYISKTKASLDITPELRTAMDIDLSDFLEGTPKGDVNYTKRNDQDSEAEIELTMDQADFFVQPLGYKKPTGTTGTAKTKALLKNGKLQELQDLSITAANFKMDPSRILFKTGSDEKTTPSRGTIPRVAAGETVASINFEREESGRYKIVVDGPFLDARTLLEKKEESEQDKLQTYPPLLISIAADQMRTAKDQTVQYAKIYADINDQGAFNQFEVDAIAGKGDIYLRYKPNAEGKRTFTLEAADAGATIKAFGIYDKIQGGKLSVYGEPKRGLYDRNLLGRATITDFKIAKAPSLAKLLSALSLPGIMQLLNNDGLGFTKLEADFDWIFHPDGSTLVLKEGRTSGNELGFTFEGNYNQRKNNVDFSGTIIPLSSVNEVISKIPLVGDIITGGTGSLFAATYKIEGESDDPDVTVNPLSVLTPGILRRILFE